MAETKSNNPIDSRFIFILLKKLTNQKNNSKLYRLLWMDNNEGRSFAGIGGRIKKCWWPKHPSWFYTASLLNSGDDRVMYNTTQKFPLERNMELWNKYASILNEKESKGSFITEDAYNALDIEYQITFESHLYNILLTRFSCFSSVQEKKEYILSCCKDAWIRQFEINKIKELDTIEDILTFIIGTARDSCGSPLVIPVSADTYVECKEETAWKILAANELKMNPIEISARIMENDRALYPQFPDSCAGSQRQWADVFASFPNYCRFVVDPHGDIHGYYSAVGLTKEQERKIQNGMFIDSEIDVSFCDPLQTPGEHILYLLNLSVNKNVKIDTYYELWSDLIELIKGCAKRGIYFTRIYYKAFLPEHRAMVIGRGFRFLCHDANVGAIFVHEMNPTSTLRILDEELASLYRNTNNRKVSATVVSNDVLEAEEGFQKMFKAIDELFRNYRFIELKPYFFGNLGLPEDKKLEQLGIATAELLRDILQYSKSLLDYLPSEYERTYSEYAQMIMDSALAGLSMDQYRFTTEYPDFQIKKIGIDAVNARDIVNFASIWIENDRLFIMRDDTLKLRQYFYEKKDCLPVKDDMPSATALVVRLLSSMIISESLLDRIPHHFVLSYYKYKEMIRSVRIVREVVNLNPFLKEELKW